MNIKDRLLARRIIDTQTGCWLWMGARHEKGYGNIRIDCQTRRVHRIAYEVFIGPIPDGLHVLHRCDVTPCFNPEHLFLGTNSDNKLDCVSKGRQSRGEKHGKLSDDQIREIKRRANLGEKFTVIAKDFQIHPSYVSRLKSGDRNYRKDVI